MVEPRDGEQMLLVEAYGPSEGPGVALQAGGLPSELPGVTVHAVIAVPGDEVVFYLVSGQGEPEVRQAMATLGVDSVRIVPAVWKAVAGRDGQ